MLKFVELDEAEFEQFVKKQGCANFLQSINAYHRYKNAGREVYLCGVKDGQTVHGTGLLIARPWRFGQQMFSLPGGPILDYESKSREQILKQLNSGLAKLAKAHKGMTIEINPMVEYDTNLAKWLKRNGYKELGEHTRVKWIAGLDLSQFKDDEELIMSFRQGHRQYIRKTEKSNEIKIKELKLEELPIFYDLLKQSAEKHQFEMPSLRYLEEMYKSFGEKVKFLIVFHEEQAVSGAMFIEYGKELVYLYSGSNTELNRKYYGSLALQWRMLTYARQKGIEYYNFYGVKPVPGDSIYNFKLGFGAKTTELMGSFILPLNLLGKLYVGKLKYKKYGEVA